MKKEKLQIINNNELDLRVLFKVLWKGKIQIIILTLIITILGLGYSLMKTPLYKSTIKVYPSGANSVSQMAELKHMAAMFGYSNGSLQQSLDIKDIVNSINVKKKLLYSLWNSIEYSKPINLIDYWKNISKEKSSDSIKLKFNLKKKQNADMKKQQKTSHPSLLVDVPLYPFSLP